MSVKDKSFVLKERTLSDAPRSINEYRDLLNMIFRYAIGNTEGLDLVIPCDEHWERSLLLFMG